MNTNTVAHLHDSELYAVSLDRGAWMLSLALRTEDSHSYTLTFSGVVAVRCTDLLLQNVVSRVLSSKLASFDEEQFEFWVDWVTSHIDASSWLDRNHRDELIVGCQSGKLEMVVIEPSAGAQFAVICKSLSLSG